MAASQKHSTSIGICWCQNPSQLQSQSLQLFHSMNHGSNWCDMVVQCSCWWEPHRRTGSANAMEFDDQESVSVLQTQGLFVTSHEILLQLVKHHPHCTWLFAAGQHHRSTESLLAMKLVDVRNTLSVLWNSATACTTDQQRQATANKKHHVNSESMTWMWKKHKHDNSKGCGAN